MNKIEIVSTSSIAHERKHRRYPLNYPVDLRFYHQGTISEIPAKSQNISMGGLLLETDFPVPWHGSVSFTMTLHGGHIVRPIEIVGEGQVVRVQPRESGLGFTMAIQCSRPLIEIAQIA